MDVKGLIAITGISGRFPKCENITELLENLLKNSDLISDNHQRWPYEMLKTPSRLGLIPDIESFDAQFFSMNPKQPDFHDARRRLLTEVVYETILDAGYNPLELRGSNTGVFLGMFTVVRGMKESASSLTANGLSYTFDFKGPSLVIDTGCSSSIYALAQAFQNIQTGNCDAAIVCTGHLQLDPHESVEFSKYGILNPDGCSKSFSNDRNGFVKSEGIVAIFLQKVSESRRIYATIKGVGVNVDGYKIDGLCHPSSIMQEKLMKTIYKKFKIDKKQIKYVESHGTGTIVGDLEEAKALGNFFQRTKYNPLKIGSIKSNLGHTEMASGLVSIAKLLIAIKTKIIPANLYFQPPENIPEIIQEKIKIVTENTPLESGLLALNSFGIGGANGHLILEPFKDSLKSVYSIYENYLIHFSGRTKESIENMKDAIIKNENNIEFLGLINKIFDKPIERFPWKGFIILNQENPIYEIKMNESLRKPTWFIYSGMGSQWSQMGRDLLEFPVFQESINKCGKSLEQYGINLLDIITNRYTNFDNVINCFSAIVAMEIGLTDLLFSIGIHPDGIIGHSLGEIGCAYADGTISREQAVLLGYARGYATTKANLFNTGLMAAIGLPLEECQKILPQDIYIACDNCGDNVTISGPTKSIQDFVENLNNQGIFTKLVNTANVPFHSPYIKEAGPILLESLQNIIPNPKKRSSKWLSSCYEEKEWYMAEYSSADYHYHNYMGMVHFNQLLNKIPQDAITIEVSPRGLLQAILKRGTNPSITKISISNNQPIINNKIHFLKSLGKYYLSGGQVILSNFQSKIIYPVGPDCPMISPLIKWDHSQKWSIPYYNSLDNYSETITIDLLDRKNKFVHGHIVDGKNIFPGTGLLVLAWKHFSKIHNQNFEKFPVIMENIKFLKAVFLPKTFLKLRISILKSGLFEIFDMDGPVCSGKLSIPSNIDREFIISDYPDTKLSNYQRLNEDDVYKELRLRGYDYSSDFRNIIEADNEGAEVKVIWKGNWITFLDAVLQSCAFKITDRALFIPIGIEKIIIDPLKIQTKYLENPVFTVKFNEFMKSLKIDGLEIRNSKPFRIERRPEKFTPILERYEFFPYENKGTFKHSLEIALSISSQIVRENCGENFKVSISEHEPIKFLEILRGIMEKSLTYCNFDILEENTKISKKYHLLLAEEFKKEFQDLARFIFTTTIKEETENFVKILQLHPYYLYKNLEYSHSDPVKIEITKKNFDWLEKLKSCFESGKIIHLISYEGNNGIIGLFNCLRLETGGKNLRVIVLDNKKQQKSLITEQMKKDLAINIYSSVENKWGSLKYLPLNNVGEILVENCTLQPLNPGDFSSFTWIEMSPHWDFRATRVKVHYSSLNFRDVLTAIGKIGSIWGSNIDIGFEYSGIDDKGRRVMGILRKGALSNYIIPDPNYTWEVPNIWTLEEAATVPVAYLTVLFSLIVRAQIKPGESILIHAGTGGVGMAAIHLATKFNCQIFTTVGSLEKRNYLKKKFPLLQDENIGNSRDTSFEETIMKATKGRGVDIVLNSLADDKFQASLKCVAYLGRFVEIGIVDIINNTPIGAGFFLKNCSFHGIVGKDLLEDDNLAKNSQLLLENIKLITPLEYTIFEDNQIGEAFRLLSSSKHIGKVLINIGENQHRMARPQVFFHPEKSYIISGGLGGFGLELADWMIKRGVRKLILNSRSPPKTGYQALCLRKWCLKGIKVETCIDDTSTTEGASKLLHKARELGQIGGIFNAAMILKDAMIKNQTVQDFEMVTRPKIKATQILDQLTQNVQSLEYFVVFSSIASGIGNPTQPNYGFANSGMEGIILERRRKNLPGIAIQYGPIGDVGYIAEKLKDKRILYEITPQSIWSCLEILDQILVQNQTSCIISSFLPTNRDLLIYQKRSVIELISHIFGIDSDKINMEQTTLNNLGMDSLMSFEIKHLLSREYDTELSIEEIRNITIKEIIEIHNKKKDI